VAAEMDPVRRAMEHIKVLSSDIGPRGSCTPADRRGSEYIIREAAGFATEARMEEFGSYTSFSWPYALIYALGAAGGALTVWRPAVGLAVGLVAAIVFYLQNTSLLDIGRWFPQWPTENVVAVIRPRARLQAAGATGGPKVVLVAHHDTSRSSIAFAPGQVASFRMTFLLMAAAFAVTPLAAALALAGTFAGWAGLFPAIYLTASIGLIAHRELTGRYTAGANDNASGVGVVLAVAEDLAAGGGLERAELWCVFTGGEEAGQTGMAAFVRRHGRDLRDALFINVDNVGAGRVRYATGEGMLGLRPCDPGLVAAARAVAADHPEWGLEGVPVTIMTTDANVLLHRGYRVISLRAEDAARLLPNWHWPTDTFENVEVGTVETCALVLREMLVLLDRPQRRTDRRAENSPRP
jgi:hypothetical protein